MKKLVVMVVLSALLPQLALAQDLPKVQPIPPGDDKIVVVRVGDKAPFTGQLFDDPTALRWANYLQQYQYRLKTDVELQRRTDQAEIDYGQKLLVAERARYQEVTADYQKRLADEIARGASPPFYQSMWFGVVVGVAGTALAVFAAAQLR